MQTVCITLFTKAVASGCDAPLNERRPGQVAPVVFVPFALAYPVLDVAVPRDGTGASPAVLPS